LDDDRGRVGESALGDDGAIGDIKEWYCPELGKESGGGYLSTDGGGATPGDWKLMPLKAAYIWRDEDVESADVGAVGDNACAVGEWIAG
jgi:hypothetical protein